MSLRALRERINLLIYDSKPKVLRVLRIISFLISLLALGTLVYYYGFPRLQGSADWSLRVIQGSFIFYVLQYLLRIFYDFAPLKFIRRTWFEGTLMVLLIVEGLSYNLFDVLLIESFFVGIGIRSFPAFSTLIIQLILLIVVGVEIGKSTNIIPNFKIHPARLFMISFGVLITFGTGMLMLPEMTVEPGGMGFVDALFTSTSASCVTGLIVVDTGTYFTFKGHFIILLLMKLGGLNIVAFAALLAFLNKWGVGVQHHSILEDLITRDSIFGSKGLFSRILGLSLIIEFIGCLAVYVVIEPSWELDTVGDKVFFAVFHSVSAFNNAGFSTFTNGMYNEVMQSAYLFHFFVTVLMFVGALGFTTMFDLGSWKKLRDRLKNPWKRPMLSTRIALYVYIGLAVIGMAAFYLLEYRNTLEGQNVVEGLITAAFQSISARSAGLNTVDVHALAVPTIILLVFLMFVGGNSYSTAGGIKTSTFALILLSVWSTIRGKRNIELFRRTLPQDDLLKAYSVLLFSIGGILTGIFVLSITEAHILEMPGRNLADLIFEEVSAFSTCGLSTGITSDLSTAGKIVLILSMYIGRLGTLTIAFALSKTVSAQYKYPDEHILVG